MSFQRFDVMVDRPRGPVRLGVAFANRDGSISVKLDSLPIAGELTLVPECSMCARLGVGSQTAYAAHKAGHPERG